MLYLVGHQPTKIAPLGALCDSSAANVVYWTRPSTCSRTKATNDINARLKKKSVLAQLVRRNPRLAALAGQPMFSRPCGASHVELPVWHKPRSAACAAHTASSRPCGAARVQALALPLSVGSRPFNFEGGCLDENCISELNNADSLPQKIVFLAQTWASWPSPRTRRYSREFSESGIRAV